MTQTATRSEVYVSTVITVIYDSYASLLETMNHMKSLKLKDSTGGWVGGGGLQITVIKYC